MALQSTMKTKAKVEDIIRFINKEEHIQIKESNTVFTNLKRYDIKVPHAIDDAIYYTNLEMFIKENNSNKELTLNLDLEDFKNSLSDLNNSDQVKMLDMAKLDFDKLTLNFELIE